MGDSIGSCRFDSRFLERFRLELPFEFYGNQTLNSKVDSRPVVNHFRVAVGPLLAVSLLCSLSCNKKDQVLSTTETQSKTAPAQPPANALSEQTAADAMGSDLVPPEDISSETVRDVKSGPLVLPTSFGRRTGDLDEMFKERRIRALVVIDPIGFFYSHGRPKGMTYEMLDQLQAYVKKKPNTGALDIKVTFIPLRPDELGTALREGVGDVIAHGVVITPGRQQNFAFTVPTKKK